MYLDEQHEQIDFHEEGIFELIEKETSFPQLDHIFQEFYSSPKISPEMANDLVHELIALNVLISKNKKYKHLEAVVLRLLPFFSSAYKSGKSIQGAGD